MRNYTKSDILKEYSDILFKPDAFVFKKTDDLMGPLVEKAIEIWSCPVSRAGRTSKEVWNSVKAMALEYHLASLDERFQINTKEFDKTDLLSFGFDVYDIKYDMKIEVKRFPKSKGYNHEDNKWFTYPDRLMQKIIDRSKVIDFLISATLREKEDHFLIGYKLLAKGGRRFLPYIKNSYFKNSDPYYDHLSAVSNGDCLYNSNINYGQSI